jgi:hypothetical protein
LRPKIRAREPEKERRGIVMKKAILIICVLSVLALLAVPVMAEVLFGDSDLDQQIGPAPRPPGGFNYARLDPIAPFGILPPGTLRST